MKKYLAILLILILSSLSYAQDAMGETTKLSFAIGNNVKVQGTIVGVDIVPAAILDDLIVQEGNVFLINDSGNLVRRLYTKEIDKELKHGATPRNKQVTIKQIYPGGVTVEHNGTLISIDMVFEGELPRCEFKRKP